MKETWYLLLLLLLYLILSLFTSTPRLMGKKARLVDVVSKDAPAHTLGPDMISPINKKEYERLKGNWREVVAGDFSITTSGSSVATHTMRSDCTAMLFTVSVVAVVFLLLCACGCTGSTILGDAWRQRCSLCCASLRHRTKAQKEELLEPAVGFCAGSATALSFFYTCYFLLRSHCPHVLTSSLRALYVDTFTTHTAFTSLLVFISICDTATQPSTLSL